MWCNPANGRVDFEEWSAYKIQRHGIEWIESLSADWDQKVQQKKKKKKKNLTYPIKIEIYIFAKQMFVFKKPQL